METIATEALTRLTDDVRAATWLLADDDPMRGYLEMLAELPPDADAWHEVLRPWLDDARHGIGPKLRARGQVAAAGALGVAALSAARDLPHEAPLAAALRTGARWLFFLVRPDIR
jgi:hypothetical protein